MYESVSVDFNIFQLTLTGKLIITRFIWYVRVYHSLRRPPRLWTFISALDSSYRVIIVDEKVPISQIQAYNSERSCRLLWFWITSWLGVFYTGQCLLTDEIELWWSATLVTSLHKFRTLTPCYICHKSLQVISVLVSATKLSWLSQLRFRLFQCISQHQVLCSEG